MFLLVLTQALFLRPIMERIQKHMAHGARLSLLPYKNNVYGEGGVFKRHVDSPRDAENMIGTLVVCLPSKHEGGRRLTRKWLVTVSTKVFPPV